MELLLYLFPILNNGTVQIAIIKSKPIGCIFTPFELFTVLASADGNEVFASTLGALEITKSQNTANKTLFFSEIGVTVFSIY